MEKKMVQVQMVKNTFDKVTTLSEMMHTSSKSDVIKASIDIADIVAKAIKDKSSIIIEDSQGNRSKLVIPGLD